MSDPKRYHSTTGGEHGIERSLLRGLREVAPPPHAKTETWNRLQAQLAATAVVAAGEVAAQSAGAAAPAGSAGGASVASTPAGLATVGALRTVAIKLALGVLVAGSMTVGAVALWPRATPVISSRAMAPAPVDEGRRLAGTAIADLICAGRAGARDRCVVASRRVFEEGETCRSRGHARVRRLEI